MPILSQRDRNELLIYGHIRAEIKYFSFDIPEDLINLFFALYYDKLFFFKVGQRCTLKDENVVEFKSKYSGNSCHVSLVMPSKIDNDIAYQFKMKIIKRKGTTYHGIGRGISDAKYIWPDEKYNFVRRWNKTCQGILSILVQDHYIHGCIVKDDWEINTMKVMLLL